MEDKSQTKAIIRTEMLSKIYRLGGHDVGALRDISVAIDRGEIVALMGASGSGKSTLLNIISGIDRSSSGKVYVDDISIASMSDKKLSRFRNTKIGAIFQSFYLQPFLTLRQNIEVAAMPNKLSKSERRARAVELATLVGLADRLDHRPRELSGGQIQRVAIARALLNRPSIIVADEPTGNLDSENSREIMQIFQRARSEFGTTVVIATHDQDIASQTDRIIKLADGVVQ